MDLFPRLITIKGNNSVWWQGFGMMAKSWHVYLARSTKHLICEDFEIITALTLTNIVIFFPSRSLVPKKFFKLGTIIHILGIEDQRWNQPILDLYHISRPSLSLCFWNSNALRKQLNLLLTSWILLLSIKIIYEKLK